MFGSNKQFYLLSFFLIALSISCFGQSGLPTSMGFDTSSFNATFEKINFDHKNLVVIGEAHKMTSMFNTELLMIKKLAKKGYRTLFLECGKSEAGIISMYMETGDTAILEHTRAKEPKYKFFLQSIYELKRKNNYDFVIKGFDFERPRSTSYLFSEWFDTTTISDNAFKQQVALLLTIKSSGIPANKMKDVFAQDEIFETARSVFPKFEMQYRNILKNNFDLFKDIVFNPAPLGNNARDSIMKQHVLREEKAGNLNNSIIIVGSYHICNDSARFIPLLANELPEKYSITVFTPVFSNCIDFNGDKPASSQERFLKYIEPRSGTEPFISFKQDTQHLVPSGRKTISTIIMGFYNQ